MQNITDIPVQRLLLLILIGGVLALSFYVVRNYIIPLLRNNKGVVKKYWQKIEIISWLVFVLVVLITVLRVNFFLSATILTVLLILGWNYWRNILAGLIIKLTDQFVKGEIISGEFGEGTIKLIWISMTEISNDKGELISIPNHVLRSSVVKHLHNKSSLKTNTFIVPLNQSNSIQGVRDMILNCPFIAVSQEIIVERLSENECSVKATLIDVSFEEKVYLYIKNNSRVE